MLENIPPKSWEQRVTKEQHEYRIVHIKLPLPPIKDQTKPNAHTHNAQRQTSNAKCPNTQRQMPNAKCPNTQRSTLNATTE